jgi:5-methylcytosine-specific restriction endonuclease McrA
MLFMIRRVALNRQGRLKSGGPLRRVAAIHRESRKRQAERDARRQVRETTLARNGWRCVAADLDTGVPCGGPLEVDEIVSRARRPGGHLDVANTQVLCARHNVWKETEPERAIELGLARHSWD